MHHLSCHEIPAPSKIIGRHWYVSRTLPAVRGCVPKLSAETLIAPEHRDRYVQLSQNSVTNLVLGLRFDIEIQVCRKVGHVERSHRAQFVSFAAPIGSLITYTLPGTPTSFLVVSTSCVASEVRARVGVRQPRHVSTVIFHLKLPRTRLPQSDTHFRRSMISISSMATLCCLRVDSLAPKQSVHRTLQAPACVAASW